MNRTMISLIVISLGIGGLAQADEKLEYNRDIRPLLSDHCFKCHGPDSAARKADLRLDVRDAAIAANAIVPGKPDESELIRRLFTADPDEVMPPPKQPKQMTVPQKELLRKWVQSGAEYQLHWSFIAPVRPSPPAVKNSAWVRNPVDAFILAKLESIGLAPAAEADRRTLARRLSLDLRGLPPAPEEVETFVNDSATDAYEKYVDRLLESKQWGEHRGRYWLDVARYADTHGIHFDNYRENWAYRDWVIGAFNRNLPFDQFTTEQLAGDLLPNRTLEQQIASAFNRCNITTNEGGIIDEEYLVLYTRDRTETVSQVWLGLTLGCTTCHDHKFDPISQREFYETAAFFNNTTQGARDGNTKDTPPIVAVPRTEDEGRLSALPGEINAARQQVEQRRQAARSEFDQWLANAKPESLATSLTTEGLTLHAPLSEGSGKVTKVQIDGNPRDVSLTDSAKWTDALAGTHGLQVQGAACEVADVGDFGKDQPFTCAAWVKLNANDSQAAICARMDNPNGYRGWDFWNQGRRIGTHIINNWPEDGLKVVGKNQVKADTWTHVAVTYDGSGKASGVKVYYDGQSQETNVENDQLKSTIRTSVPLKIGQRHTAEQLSGSVSDLRIYKRAIPPAEVESLAKSSLFTRILAKSSEQRTDAEKNDLYGWWLGTMDKSFQDAGALVGKLEREQEAIKSRGTIAHVMQERSEPATAFILFRGEYDKRRDSVKAKTPSVLPPFPSDAPQNRLGFAQWLLRPEHPLTTRVTVNRFWQELFGTGIVRTSGDFGVAGEAPSNQQLLDWLAVEFRESGWDMKRFFKLLVTSATYRQAATTTPEKLERDPQNRFLSRGPRFRMDAEMVRDYALAAGGLLVPKIGGPSVRPYQPDGVWEAVAIIGSNTRDYRTDTGESLYRRSMYTFWKRSAPPASLDIFNAPSREVCTVRRERTNTPLQALVTLNDPQYVEAARSLAQNALRSNPASDEAGLQLIAMRLLARPFRSDELAIAADSLKGLTAYYQAHADDAKALISVGESKPNAELNPAKLAAWTMLANELMNLDEVLSK